MVACVLGRHLTINESGSNSRILLLFVSRNTKCTKSKLQAKASTRCGCIEMEMIEDVAERTLCSVRSTDTPVNPPLQHASDDSPEGA